MAMMTINNRIVIRPGELRYSISWWRRAMAPGSFLGEDDNYVKINVLDCRAKVTSMTGRELMMAQQVWADVRYKIEQHYYIGLDDTMFVSGFIDGKYRNLDIIDLRDPLGTELYQVAFAKDLVEKGK